MKTKTVLLIEDDPFLVDIYTTKLREFGFSVEVATDGNDGWKKLQKGKPDLLLLDIVLPNVDGWELLGKIKKDSRLSKLKVIILSNLSQKEEVEKGLGLGAVKYLIKAHYTPSEVAAEIKNLLEK